MNRLIATLALASIGISIGSVAISATVGYRVETTSSWDAAPTEEESFEGSQLRSTPVPFSPTTIAPLDPLPRNFSLGTTSTSGPNSSSANFEFDLESGIARGGASSNTTDARNTFNEADVFFVIRETFDVVGQGTVSLIFDYDAQLSSGLTVGPNDNAGSAEASFDLRLSTGSQNQNLDIGHRLTVVERNSPIEDRSLVNTSFFEGPFFGPEFFGDPVQSTSELLEDDAFVFASRTIGGRETLTVSVEDGDVLELDFGAYLGSRGLGTVDFNNTGFFTFENSGGVSLFATDPLFLASADGRPGVVSTVPLPAAFPLLAAGLIGMGALARRKKPA